MKLSPVHLQSIPNISNQKALTRSHKCLLDPSYVLQSPYALHPPNRSFDHSRKQQQSWYVLSQCTHACLTLGVYLLTFTQVKQGDSVPNIDLFEDSPGNKVNLSQELSSGKGVVIGVPAAFSPGCSDTHIPGYVASDKLKDAGKVFVVSVNDAFV